MHTYMKHLFYFLFMSLYMHMYPGACGGQKRALDPLELESQAIVTQLLCVLGTKLRLSTRAARALNH